MWRFACWPNSLPAECERLRPVALLNASVGRLQPLDENDDPVAMGLNNTRYSVSGLVVDFLLLRGRTLEGGGNFWAAQSAFAAVSDSVGHRWLLEAMVRRGMPRAEALWYVREAQRSTQPHTWALVRGGGAPGARFYRGLQLLTHALHVVCATRHPPVEPVVGEGGSGGWAAEDGRLTTHPLWADDTWLLALTPEQLIIMTGELQEAMRDNIGLLLRSDKYTVARSGPDNHLPPTENVPSVLQSMTCALCTRKRVWQCWEILCRSISATRQTGRRGAKQHGAPSTCGSRLGDKRTRPREIAHVIHYSSSGGFMVRWTSSLDARSIATRSNHATSHITKGSAPVEARGETWQEHWSRSTRHVKEIEAHVGVSRWDAALAA